mmetsp:Transcript_24371/g.39135  ORF Transcript_24371/g.39135 Transcript_24371/m.39135 type:complete len:102 (-) Transcript_24371:721-1026(-)
MSEIEADPVLYSCLQMAAVRGLESRYPNPLFEDDLVFDQTNYIYFKRVMLSSDDRLIVWTANVSPANSLVTKLMPRLKVFSGEARISSVAKSRCVRDSSTT